MNRSVLSASGSVANLSWIELAGDSLQGLEKEGLSRTTSAPDLAVEVVEAYSESLERASMHAAEADAKAAGEEHDKPDDSAEAVAGRERFQRRARATSNDFWSGVADLDDDAFADMKSM